VPYGWAVRCRNWLYERDWKRTFKAQAAVVSVGNLTLGGTGKTPCVEYVARHYRKADLRAAILSRGYAGNGGRNDEALVLEQNLPDVPHLQGADRVMLAQTAVEELDSEILILDDGFQHRRLQRDLDIVVVDATNPWGHGYLFPRGLLREPPASLRRAGVIVLTRCDQVTAQDRVEVRQRIHCLKSDVPIAETVHRPVGLQNSRGESADLTMLKGRPVAAFSGIGNPEAFRATLLALQAELIDFRVFPDHHGYGRDDVEELRTWAATRPKECLLVTTQKDLVKLQVPLLGGHPLWALQICLEFETGKEQFDAKLNEVLSVNRY
jgi:tetraacyldisaccharide 4'-kinase